MLNRLLRRPVADAKVVDIFTPHMPEVDVHPPRETNEIFDLARRSAVEGGEPTPSGPQRHISIVTPGRMVVSFPSPAPGSMPPQGIAQIEHLLPSRPRRKIAVIGYTETGAIVEDIARAIPFLGYLRGFAYVGHAVWVFEGHHTALAAGCHEADLLLVDGGMLPYLEPNWREIAAVVMASAEIYIHDRATYTLRSA